MIELDMLNTYRAYKETPYFYFPKTNKEVTKWDILPLGAIVCDNNNGDKWKVTERSNETGLIVLRNQTQKQMSPTLVIW